MNYGAILADPPWDFTPPGRRPVQNQAWYGQGSLTVEQICSLQVPSAPDSVLFLWCLPGNIPSGLEVMNRWGFRYLSNIVWGKTTKAGTPFMGMGGFLRNSHEHLLIGKKGRPERKNRSTRSLLLSPPLFQGSKKPDVHGLISDLVHGPYLELFARESYPGFETLGSDLDGRDIRDSLEQLR